MLSVFFTVLLIGICLYFYIQYKYYELQLKNNKNKLNKIINGHDGDDGGDDKYCPTYYKDRYNETRYNPDMKKFTCQFNPNHLEDSGFYYNSPDGCCNNRPKELNKILELVIDNARNSQFDDGNEKDKLNRNVWCLSEQGTKCTEFIGKCPNDNATLSNIPNLPMPTEADCYKFNSILKCSGLDENECVGKTGCVYVNNKDKGGNTVGCVAGSGSGPYKTLSNSSVGYIHGDPTATAGNSNPFVGISQNNNNL